MKYVDITKEIPGLCNPYDPMTPQTQDQLNKMRIIGVELKLDNPRGGGALEIAMFEIDAIVPNYFCFNPQIPRQLGFPITIHTNMGDINGRIG